MANIAWIGQTTPGDLTVGANWVGGTPPAGSDVAVFNAGSQSVDPALGQIAALAGIEIYPGYAGTVENPVTIGGSGNEMISSVTAIKHMGSVPFWFKDSAGSTVDVYIRATDPETIVNLGGDTIANLHCMRGTITVAGTIGNITQITVSFVDNPTTDVTLSVINNANAISDYFQVGGVATVAMNATRMQVCNGTLIYNSSAAISNNLVVGGGIVNHNSSGTIANLQMYGGRTDLGDTIKTITKSAVFPGATFVKNDTIHTFTAALVDLRENVSGN